MTGTIYANEGSKNYYAILNYYDEGGKRQRKWIDTGIALKGNNKRKAQARLQEILAEYDESGIDITKDAHFTDYVVNWLESLKNSIAATTYDGYVLTLNAHILPYFRKKKLKVADVTPAVIQQYISAKLEELSPNTVRKHLANISKCLDSAVKQNIIAYNPVKRVELPKKERFTGAKHYNARQIEELLDCSKGDPLEIVILLTIFYGLRRSEVLGLKWGAVDFEAKTLAIRHTVIRVDKILHANDTTKNDASYTVFPVSDKIVSELERWRGQQQAWRSLQPNDYHDSDYVCTKPNGKLLQPDYVSRHFALLLKKNGLPPIRFHDLRHSSASYLKALGFDLKDIQVWLRHKDIQTTLNLYACVK